MSKKSRRLGVVVAALGLMTGALAAVAPAAGAQAGGGAAPRQRAVHVPRHPHLMPRPGRTDRAGRADRRPGSPYETKVCDTCAPPLLYGGGPVMGTASTVGEVTVTPIYWAPGGPSAFPAGYTDLINSYVSDVAAASGTNTNVYSTDTEYYQAQAGTNIHIQYLTHFGGGHDDTTAYPASGCTVNAGMQACIDDPQLQAELSRYLVANHLPADMAHMYPVFFPPGIATGDGTGKVSLTDYCGYHSLYTVGAQQSPVVYGNEPYQPDGCGESQSPNISLPADAAVDTLSHEINESVTDPSGNAWADANGNENGDECSSDFGTLLGSADPANPSTTGYNQLINGHPYYTQEEFSNADFASGPKRGCVQGESQVGGAPPAKDTVTVSATPTSLPADGTSTSTITVAVTDMTGTAVPGDTVSLSIGTVGQSSATCGTLSSTKATTDPTGQVTATYTASADNVTCSVIAVEAQTGQSANTTIVQGSGTPPPPKQAYVPLQPTRLADTRPGSGAQGAGTPVTFGQTFNVTMPPAVPAGATAVLSVTAVDASRAGYLTVYPAGQPLPVVSNLNYVPGSPTCSVADCVAPNLVTVAVGSGGAVSIFNGPAQQSGATDVLVDLEGYYAAPDPSSHAGEYFPLFPARVADTRCSASPTAGACAAEQLPAANASLPAPQGQGGTAVTLAGEAGVGAGASAVVLNVTVTNTGGPGFLTAYPDGTNRPLASNLNWVTGQTTSNRVIVPLGTDGKVGLFNGSATPTDVIVDVVGWFSGASGTPSGGSLFSPTTPVRALDTRNTGQTLGAGANLTTQYTGQFGVPQGATAAVVNVTDANAGAPSFFTLSPTAPAGVPSSSDLNFSAGETRANADLATLSPSGTLDLYNLSGRVDAISDLAGYFTPA